MVEIHEFESATAAAEYFRNKLIERKSEKDQLEEDKKALLNDPAMFFLEAANNSSSELAREVAWEMDMADLWPTNREPQLVDIFKLVSFITGAVGQEFKDHADSIYEQLSERDQQIHYLNKRIGVLENKVGKS